MAKLQPDLSGNPFYATQWSEKIDFVEPKGLGAEGGNSCPKNCKMYFVKCIKKPESMTQVLYFMKIELSFQCFDFLC